MRGCNKWLHYESGYHFLALICCMSLLILYHLTIGSVYPLQLCPIPILSPNSHSFLQENATDIGCVKVRFRYGVALFRAGALFYIKGQLGHFFRGSVSFLYPYSGFVPWLDLVISPVAPLYVSLSYLLDLWTLKLSVFIVIIFMYNKGKEVFFHL